MATSAVANRGFCHTCDAEVTTSLRGDELECDECHGFFVEKLQTVDNFEDLMSFRTAETVPSDQNQAAEVSESGPPQPPQLGGGLNRPPRDPLLSLLQSLDGGLNMTSLGGSGGGGGGTEGGEGQRLDRIGDYGLGDISRIIDELMAAHPSMRTSQPTSSKTLNELEEVIISTDTVEKECSVCQETFEIGLKCLRLPCEHIFHKECIHPWLKDHNTCPVCRKELPEK
mmetsp:Transcript_32260/g.41458  ORF Transcript_32260/g.41458 Transcript_32260/m.41458 type:complete len:227 (+) Transcript_32260:91-771(+)